MADGMEGEDKRSTQLVLPLGLTYEPKHKDLVKQHWHVTFARQGRMSVTAKRIMARVIDQVRDDDFKLRPFYQFRIVDIITDAGVTKETATKEIQGALRELTASQWASQVCGRGGSRLQAKSCTASRC